MRPYSLIAPAKINLYLEIVGDRLDGYHELVMVLQSIALADQIEVFSLSTDTIRVTCDDPQVPQDSSNLAYKAAEVMVRQFPDCFAKYGGVGIHIQKQIPMGAGLAGGSADAAAVLVGINLLWQLGLTQPELQALGATIGSDVPFCILGGTALATGRGEMLDSLPVLDHLHVVLAKYRSIAISTPWAYKTYRQQFGHTYCPPEDHECRRQKIHSGPLLTAIGKREDAQIGQLLHNDLEKVVLPAHPLVQQLRDRFQQLDVLGTMMSGSGSTVFALVSSAAQAQQVKDQMRATFPDPDLELWTTQLTGAGIHLPAVSP